ncbi:hypothetical protein [Enterococcus sp. DIV0187]|uniref:hypothetical protein n=1 Tax=Enterococcus sp. DIV0187 TaxID=2774644 RepID=UPI003F2690CA
MAFRVEEFAAAINQSNLLLEKGKLVIINNRGIREEYTSESEIVGKGTVGFYSDRIIWTENGKEVSKNISVIKSANGIPTNQYK